MTASLLHRAPTAPAPRPRTRRRGLPSTTLAALGFLTPFMTVYILFVLWPVVEAVRISLYDWDLLGFTRELIGADNYERMLWGTGSPGT
jgi:ABC-type sugar transport system permease subunit